ncbi:conserved hypothetical protein [Syntrophobacter sp. SbD1]|nr:conserved hypothetical protein [Syntrophobacter sp. SbD1]
MADKSILDAFHIMWNKFPEPVLLIQKDRTVLAVNALAQTAGVQPGIKCFTLNPEGAPDGKCRQCRANEALGQGVATRSEVTRNGKTLSTYWIPLDEPSDIYVHFTLGFADMMGIADD